ncbi:hypothetical protein L3Q82_000432 [Scortum barcoo]|uniref:Uncharacterized protein n=1 Tax=Scortum barcoo TaxID=214431 RepID=A0ACB8WFF9_9TELE|nr:hypothetical protein L3Q82_000432 [Scortum barcoo]
MEAFSDAGGGLCHFFTQSHLTGSKLPMRPYSCGSTNQKLPVPQAPAGGDSHSPVGAPPPALVAIVNVYVLVTSVNPLTSFLHDIGVVTTNQEQRGRPTKLESFLLQQLGPATSHQALQQVKKVVGEVLQAAVSTNEKQQTLSRCVLCYQLLTFTLLFSGSITPVVVQVETDLTFSSLRCNTFDGQITRDLILEDTLHFLLPPRTRLSSVTHLSSETHTPTGGRQLYPSTSSSSSSGPLSVSDLLIRISHYYELQRNLSCRGDETEKPANQEAALTSSQDRATGPCLDPHLRQIYTDPPLTLTPPFSPWVKEYRAEVTFDTVMVRIRPEPVSSACRVHLDEHRGPRMANYPVGLGDSRISILVTDDAESEPVVMTIYTVHVYRESRPSLPMFGDHVMCSFLQDCGLLVQPGRSCGLQPFIKSQSSLQTCSSGHAPGVLMVEVCSVSPQVLFIGDSTNRGMMYFLMERVNSSLEAWGKAHDTLVYRNLNGGRTLVSYSYYPQFWLEKKQRPTFRQALLQLLDRSRPMVNSNMTVLVVGGVQWLNTNHLRTIREVLNRKKSRSSLHRENRNIIATAKHHGYEVIDTFSITMGRYKEFLQGRCTCHFHEVEKSRSSRPSDDMTSTTNRTRSTRTGPEVSSQSAVLDPDQGAWPRASSYHVRGAVNQVY